MVLCGTKNGYSMASLEEPFEAPLFLRVYTEKIIQVWNEKESTISFLCELYQLRVNQINNAEA